MDIFRSYAHENYLAFYGKNEEKKRFQESIHMILNILQILYKCPFFKNEKLE